MGDEGGSGAAVAGAVDRAAWLSAPNGSSLIGMAGDAIFNPLSFRNLTVKNRVFRSNISGRFDNYDGSGNPARVNWETSFAKGGVGAIRQG